MTTATVTVIMVVVLQPVTGAVGAHMLRRSVYRRLRPPVDGPEELAEREADD